MPSVVSQTAEYALRAVAWLAKRGDQPQTADQIAEATRVPGGYLRKVMQSLVRAGLVRAQRGLHGGFSLSVPPTQLAVLDVINAIDPIERIHACPLGIKSHGQNLCALHHQIDDAVAHVERAFARTTIADILAEPGVSGVFCDVAIREPVKSQRSVKRSRS